MYSDDAYNVEMKEHERRGCACSKPTLEGARLRAGQWWVDGKDSRLSDEEWFKMLEKLEPLNTPSTPEGDDKKGQRE